MNERTNWLKNAAARNGLLLAAFAVVAALILGITYAGTADSIAASKRQFEARALIEVLENTPHDNLLLDDTLEIPQANWAQLNVDEGARIHVATYENRVTGFVIPTVAGNGYSGDISIRVGVDLQGIVQGVRIVDHRETPGLGDKVELKKSDWVLGFDGKSLNNPALSGWRVKKDGGQFDSFTGATITPRAVVEQLAQVLAYFHENQASLVAAAEAQILTTTHTTAAGE